jgi:hypothetical protein
VNIDTELATWQQEWREQTEPLPDVRKKIKRQDQWTTFAIAAACILLVLSAIAALHTHNSFFSGFAAGLWFTCLTTGAYAWRVKRGTWKPTAQTTAAYIELWHKRAIARERIIRFGFRFLLTAIVLYAGFAAWHWRDFSKMGVVVLTAMIAELFWFVRIGRKKRQEIELTQKLLQSSKEDA